MSRESWETVPVFGAQAKENWRKDIGVIYKIKKICQLKYARNRSKKPWLEKTKSHGNPLSFFFLFRFLMFCLVVISLSVAVCVSEWRLIRPWTHFSIITSWHTKVWYNKGSRFIESGHIFCLSQLLFVFFFFESTVYGESFATFEHL